MKKVICFLLLAFLMTCQRTNAQGFFNQKGAWIKNQLQQIALWEIYSRDIEKGYTIAKQGLNTIAESKHGEWLLHIDHFNSLLAVNPAIKKYSKAAEILLLQAGIKKLAAKSDDDYINAVWMHLIDKCTGDVDQLNLLLSPGNYQMTDDERISNIDKLCEGMKDKYAFAKSFTGDGKIISVQEAKEKNELQTGRLLHNVQP